MSNEKPVFCSSHIHIDESLKRQEKILEDFRKENSEHKEAMARIVGEVCSKIDVIKEIKTTQEGNMRRREDFANQCELRRSEFWISINQMKQDTAQGLNAVSERINLEVSALKLKK